jgi:hypothetical protein
MKLKCFLPLSEYATAYWSFEHSMHFIAYSDIFVTVHALAVLETALHQKW